MVSCQKGPTRHAYAWQIGPFWQDTLEIFIYHRRLFFQQHSFIGKRKHNLYSRTMTSSNLNVVYNPNYVPIFSCRIEETFRNENISS